MKKLTNFLKNFAIDYVIKYLTDNKDEVVKKLNKEINVPILNEKQEKELLDAIYDSTLTVVKGIKQMIPAMIIKAVIPKVLDMILRQFKGIEKIERIVAYMEEENDADREIKKLKDEIALMKQDHILIKSGQEQLADEIDKLTK